MNKDWFKGLTLPYAEEKARPLHLWSAFTRT